MVSSSIASSNTLVGNHSSITSGVTPLSTSYSTPYLTTHLTPSSSSDTSHKAPSNTTLSSNSALPSNSTLLRNSTISLPSNASQEAVTNESCSGSFVNIFTATLEWWYPRVYDFGACVLFVAQNNTAHQWTSRSATTTFNVASALAAPQAVQSVYINTLVNSTYTDTVLVNTPLPKFAATRVVTQTAFRSLNVTKGPLPYPNAVITPPPATIAIPYGPSPTSFVTSGTPVVYWWGYQIDRYKPSTYQNGSQFCYTSRSVHDLPSPYIIHYKGPNPDGYSRITGPVPADFMSAIDSGNATAGRWMAKPTLIVVEQEVCAVESSHPIEINSMTATFFSLATLSNGLIFSTTFFVASSAANLMTSETSLDGPSVAGTVFVETTETSFMVPTQTATVVQVTTHGNMQIPLGITTANPPSTTPTVLPAVAEGDGNTGSSQLPGSSAGSNNGPQPGSNSDSSQGAGSQSGGSGSSQSSSGSEGGSAAANEAGSSGATSTNQDTGTDLGSIIAGVIGAAQSEPKSAQGVASPDNGNTNQGGAADVTESGAGQITTPEDSSSSQSGQIAGSNGNQGQAQEQTQGQNQGENSGSSVSSNSGASGSPSSVGNSGNQGQTAGSSTPSNSGVSGSAVSGQNSQGDQSSNGALSSSTAQTLQGQQPGGSGESIQLAPAASSVVRIGSVQVTQQAVPVLQVGTSTLYPGSGSGSGSFAENGVTIAAATNGVIVNGQTSTIAGSSTAHMITAGGQGVLVQPTPAFIIEGEAIVAGAPARTIDGTVYSLAPSGTALIIGASTMVISQPPTSPAAASKLLSIGSNTYTANAFSDFIVGRQTLVPGGPAITVSGNTVVSLPSPGTVAIIGTKTQVLGSAITPAPMITLAGTIYKPNSGGTFYVDNQALVPGSSIVDHGTTISLSGTSTLIVNGIPTVLTFIPPITTPSVPTVTAPPLLTINNALVTAAPGSKPTYPISGQALTAGGTIIIASPNGPETLILSPNLESLTAMVAGTTAVSSLDQYYIHTPSILPPVLSFSSFPTAAAFSNFPLASSTFIALPGTATGYLLPALTGSGKQTLLPGATATEVAQGTTFLIILGSRAGELTVEALNSTGGIAAVTTSRLFPASATAATTTSPQSGSLPIGSGSASGDNGLAAVTSGGAGKVVKGSASSPRAKNLGVVVAGAVAVVFGLAVGL